MCYHIRLNSVLVCIDIYIAWNNLCYTLPTTSLFDKRSLCRRAKVLKAKDPTILEIESGAYAEDFEADSRLAALDCRQASGCFARIFVLKCMCSRLVSKLERGVSKTTFGKGTPPLQLVRSLKIYAPRTTV